MRGFRITFSVLCGIVCVLLVALWVRSYWQIDGVVLPLTSSSCLSMGSMPGCFGGGILPNSSLLSGTSIPSWNSQSTIEWLSIPKFSRPYDPSRLWGIFLAKEGCILVPYWFAVLILTFFAAAPWMPRKFSLRTLFIAVGVIAVLLGLARLATFAG